MWALVLDVYASTLLFGPSTRTFSDALAHLTPKTPSIPPPRMIDLGMLLLLSVCGGEPHCRSNFL